MNHSVIIRNLHVISVAIFPDKADPELVIHPYGVLALTIA